MNRDIPKIQNPRPSDRQSKIQNTYTHTPELHPHLLLGSLQLLTWLFLHPTAWCSYVARLDSGLRPNFCLAQLSWTHWQNPALHRLLILGYLVPGLVGLLLGSVLQWLGIAGEGVLFGVAAGPLVGLIFGLTLSLASGIVAGIMGELVFGIAFGRPNLLVVDLIMSIAVGTIFGLVGGVAGHVADNIGRQQLTHSLARQFGGFLLGLLISAGVITAATSLVVGAVTSLQGNVGNAALVALSSGVGLGMLFAVIVGRRTHQWRRGALFGLLLGGGSGITLDIMFFTLFNEQLGGWHLVLALEVTTAALFTALFVLPYILAEQTAGPWAGVIAGAVSSGAGHIALWVVISLYNPWLNLLVNLTLVIMGLTMGWWRPLLFYPFGVAWGWTLWRLDKRGLPRQVSWLCWHPAFWDEFQWLRWPGLDSYLVEVAERNPAEGQSAINFLATGRQRWAAQAAQIELEVRRLEHCPHIEPLSQVYLDLITGELTGQINGLLHSFSRLSQDVHAALNQVAVSHQRLALNAIQRRLDTLHYELSVSPNPFARRFQRVAEQWQQIVANYGRDLARAVELRQEINNVYLYSVPLTAQHQTFVGRTKLAIHLEQLLLRQEAPTVLLYGQRRMGKTSFLRNLERLLPQTIAPMFVDGEKVAGASSYPDFLYNLAQEMTKSAESLQLMLPTLPYQSLVIEPLPQFNHWLNIIEQKLKATGRQLVLLALDEIEALDRVSSKGRLEQADILNTLRHLSQYYAYIKLLLAGSYPPEEFGRWSMSLNPLYPMKISYLEEDEARQLIERPVGDFALRYEPEASQKILELTSGHPHLIQLLCHELVALKNEQDLPLRRLTRPADVEVAVPRALKHGGFFFTALENQVSPAGRSLLRLLAKQDAGARVGRTELVNYLNQSDDNIEQTLTLLTRHDLIELVGETYRFQVELIRRWFAQ